MYSSRLSYINCGALSIGNWQRQISTSYGAILLKLYEAGHGRLRPGPHRYDNFNGGYAYVTYYILFSCSIPSSPHPIFSAKMRIETWKWTLTGDAQCDHHWSPYSPGTLILAIHAAVDA